VTSRSLKVTRNGVTHYEVMKGDTACQQWGGLGNDGHSRSLEITLINRHIGVPISIPWCPYLVPFLTYSEILVENRRSEPTPPLFGTAVGGDLIGISLKSLASEN